MNKIKVISGGCKREGQTWFSKCRAAQVNSSIMSMSVQATAVAQPWQRSLPCRLASPLFSRDHLLEDRHERSRICNNSGKGTVFLCSFELCKAFALHLDLHGAVLLENEFCFSKGDRGQKLVPSNSFWDIVYDIALKWSSYGSFKESGFTSSLIGV